MDHYYFISRGQEKHTWLSEPCETSLLLHETCLFPAYDTRTCIVLLISTKGLTTD